MAGSGREPGIHNPSAAAYGLRARRQSDDAATLAMGEAFDDACVLLGRLGNSVTVRETIAKRIIAAAQNGERNPARLCEQAYDQASKLNPMI